MIRSLALLAVALLAVLLWLWLGADRAPVAPSLGGGGPDAPQTSPHDADGTAATPAEKAPERSALAPLAEDAPQRGAAPPPTFVVRGRCVTAVREAPLADCVVSARREVTAGDRDAAWTAAHEAVVTGDDGAFEVSLAHDEWNDSIAVRITRDGFVARTGRFPRPDPGAEVELGDVVMLPAIDVDGELVDEQGAPIANAGLMFVHIVLAGDAPTETDTMLRARSDAAGRFAFDGRAHPGEWYVGVEDSGALIAPRSVKLTDDDARHHLRIVVERPDPKLAITGAIVDEAGRALPGMRVSATGEGFFGRCTSDERGRFQVHRAGPAPNRGERGVELLVLDPRDDLERVRPEKGARFAWGARDVDVVMRRRTAQPVRVVDADGRPVLDYTLFVLRADGAGRRQLLRAATQRGRHADGRCAVPGLRVGPHAAIVAPRDAALANTTAVPFVVTAATNPAEHTITLPRRAPLHVAVRTAAGGAVADSEVELLLPLTGDDADERTPYEALRHADRGERARSHTVVARARTDGDGQVRFDAPVGAFTLRVRGEDHVPALQAVEVFAPTSRAEVTVAAASRITGTLQPPDALAALRRASAVGGQPVRVVVTGDDGAESIAVVDERGGFDVRGLAPGRHDVKVRYWLRTGEVRADDVTLAVAERTLQPGERAELTVDVAALVPGTIHGRVVAGGAPLADVHCFLRRNDPGGRLTLRIATDGDGRYAGDVPPGDYTLAITYPAQPGPGWLHMVVDEPRRLAPGERQQRDFDVPLRRVRVTVLDGDDRPVEGLRLRVVREGYDLPGGLETDADGRVEIFPAPYDAFELKATIDGNRRTLGPVDLPPGVHEGDVVVRTS